MVELQVDVVLLWAAAPALSDFHGHGTRHNVSAGKILGHRSIPLHEPLTLGVDKVATLGSAALSHQAASAIDASGVELDKLHVLAGQASPGNHGSAVTSAGVGRGGREVGLAGAALCHHSVVGVEPVDGAVLQAESNHSPALSILHQQVDGKVLNEVVAVIAEALAVQSVEEGVTGPVSNAAAPMSLTSLAVLVRLAAKGTLVDLALWGPAERHPVVPKLNDGGGRLSGHVVDCILVSKPVRAFDSVVHVPPPIIRLHVAEGCVDASLRCHSVAASGEELGDDGSLETFLNETKCCAEASAACTNDHSIVLVVNNWVLSRNCVGVGLGRVLA